MGFYPKNELNKCYHLDQAAFIDYNGWAFWDTEDVYPSQDYMGPEPHLRTPTHMDVARMYPWDEAWAKDNPTGGMQMHGDVEAKEEVLYLWREPTPGYYRTGGIRMEFCCTTISEEMIHRAEHLLHWPDGHLCIYGHGAIDSTMYKFRQGSIGWDCENGDPKRIFKDYGNKIYLDPANEIFSIIDELADQQRLTEALPSGLYHIQFDGLSEQWFNQILLCMKEDIDQENDIELPRDEPFYLMQYVGGCQKVKGMYSTPVELKWQTEVDHKTVWEDAGLFDRMFVELEMNSWGHALAYGRTDTLPNGHYSQEYLAIWYCFYQKIVKFSYSRTDRIPEGVQNTAIAMNDGGEYVVQIGAIPNQLCPS